MALIALILGGDLVGAARIPHGDVEERAMSRIRHCTRSQVAQLKARHRVH